MIKKRNVGNELLESMKDAIDYMRGKKTHVLVHKIEIPDKIDVRAIRKKLNFSRQG